MSAAAEPGPRGVPWERLEAAARAATEALAGWRRRALQAEEEVGRLRTALEDVTAAAPPPVRGDAADEVRRLRAQSALYLSRMAEARRRVSSLLARVEVLEEEEER